MPASIHLQMELMERQKLLFEPGLAGDSFVPLQLMHLDPWMSNWLASAQPDFSILMQAWGKASQHTPRIVQQQYHLYTAACQSLGGIFPKAEQP